MTPREALAELLAGNRRFVLGETPHLSESIARRREHAAAQQPWAVVFGCIDSRVPAEVVFDRGLGEVLVVRTAGTAIDDVVLGSVAFGATQLGVPLVVVLGHRACGAVTAAVKAARTGERPDGAVGAVVDAIAPAIEALGADAGVDEVARANVERQVASLRSAPGLGALREAGALHVVGAFYDLETGEVSVTVPDDA